MEAVYSNATEAAKGLRSELKAAFPGIKFSVRTRYFSGGESINISWSFGPTTKAVGAISKKYEYGRFDGMTDSSSVEDTLVSMPDGEVKILGGAKFVQTSRNFESIKNDYRSESLFIERVMRDLCALQGFEFKSGSQNINGTDKWDSYRSVIAVTRGILSSTDLTSGYGGLRHARFEAGSQPCDSFEVIPMAAQASVAPAFSAGASVAAAEIVGYLGNACLTMRQEALRSAVSHRCYIRYVELDREDVFGAVLKILLQKLNG